MRLSFFNRLISFFLQETEIPILLISPFLVAVADMFILGGSLRARNAALHNTFSYGKLP